MDMTGAKKSRMPMHLREAVEKYLSAAGEYGKALPLAAFGLSRPDTEHLFGTFDEDYHISRYFHFTNESGEPYQVNGFTQTHVAIDSGIQAIL